MTTNFILSRRKQLSHTLLLSIVLLIAVVMLSACGANSPSQSSATRPDDGIAGDGNLSTISEFILDEFDLPALSGLMVHNGTVVEKSAVGFRIAGGTDPLSSQDHWHIGSITKSMTATLAAVLVEQGTVSWNSTIAEVFPELNAGIRSEYLDVRLDELLSHTAGIPQDDDEVWANLLNSTSSVTEQRYQLVANALTFKPEAPRGTLHYSNINCVVAGAMLEKMTGSSWKDLIQSNVFLRLGMTSMRFGDGGTEGQADELWGHRWDGGRWVPVDPTIASSYNTPGGAPAGTTTYATLDDIALYMKAHLSGTQGISGLVTKESYTKLHTPLPNTQYGLGWNVVADQNYGSILFHSGSNTRWFALLVVYPALDVAIFAATNASGEDAVTAVNEFITVLEKRADAAFGKNN